MFQWRKKRKKRGQEGDESESSDEDEEESEEEEVGVDSEKMEWGKAVEPELRRWIECKGCRRDVADEYFNNPPVRKRELLFCD
jgi:bloom syndrome protein